MGQEHLHNQRICPRVPLPAGCVLEDDSGHQYSVAQGNVSLSGFGIFLSSEQVPEQKSPLKLSCRLSNGSFSLPLESARKKTGEREEIFMGGQLGHVKYSDRCLLAQYVRVMLRQEKRRSIFYEGAGFKSLF